jgi:signal transduction histidine kinase
MKIVTHLVLIFGFAIGFAVTGIFVLSQLLLGLAPQQIELNFLGFELGKDFLISAAMAGFAVLVLVSIFTIFLMYVKKNVVSQIKKVQVATSYVLRGKTNYKIDLEGNDELEQLGKSFELLKSWLKKKMELEYELSQSRKELERERLMTIGLVAARLAHDIRNPLSVIKNTVEIIRIKFKGNIDENMNTQLQRLTTSVTRISHQIDDVLDYVRASPLEISEISLNGLIDSVITAIKKPEKITIIKPENDLVVACDPKKMEVVFVNLLVNAIQAMDGEGEIKIRYTEQSNFVVIDVMDSGPGIPKESLSKIFEPLFTTKQKGTGLGLSSCKNIVEQHFGKIIAANNPTRFTIKLPRKIAIPNP